MHKADKELAEVANRWEEIKKGTSQVCKGHVESPRLCAGMGDLCLYTSASLDSRLCVEGLDSSYADLLPRDYCWAAQLLHCCCC